MSSTFTKMVDKVEADKVEAATPEPEQPAAAPAVVATDVGGLRRRRGKADEDEDDDVAASDDGDSGSGAGANAPFLDFLQTLGNTTAAPLVISTSSGEDEG